MKAMREKVGKRTRSEKNAEKQSKDKKGNVVSDMSKMKPSKFLIVAVGDKIRGVLQSESSSKKARAKVKAKVF